MDRHAEVNRKTSRATLHYLTVKGGDEVRRAHAKAELDRRDHNRQLLFDCLGLTAQLASAVAALALVWVVAQQ